MANTAIISKAQLAREIGVSKARISQLVSGGLPVRADGKLDRILALNWIKDTLSGPNGREDTGALVGAIAALQALGFDETVPTIGEPTFDMRFAGVSNLSVVAGSCRLEIGKVLLARRVPNARVLVDEIMVKVIEEAAGFADHLVDEDELPKPPAGGSWSAHKWFARDPMHDGAWAEIESETAYAASASPDAKKRKTRNGRTRT